jgi:hypothetical protein
MGLRKKLRTTFLLAAVFSLGLGAVSRADRGGITDPADSPGKLDVIRTGYGHEGTDILRHRVVMEKPWTKKALRSVQLNAIRIFFSIDNEPSWERRLTIDVDAEGRLKAVMDKRDGTVLGEGRARKPTRKKVSVSFSRELLGTDGAYSWFVITVYTARNDGPCGTPSDVVQICTDRAPDSGKVRHRAG